MPQQRNPKDKQQQQGRKGQAKQDDRRQEARGKSDQRVEEPDSERSSGRRKSKQQGD